MASKNKKCWLGPDDESFFSDESEASNVCDLKAVSDEPSVITNEMTNIFEYYGRSHPRSYARDDIDIAAFNKSALAAMTTSQDDLVLAYKTSDNKLEYIRANKNLLLPWAQVVTARMLGAGMLGSPLTEEVETAPIASKTNDIVASCSNQNEVYATTVKEENDEKSKHSQQRQKYKFLPKEIGKIEEKCNTNVCVCKADDVIINDDIIIPEVQKALHDTRNYGLAKASTSRDFIPGEDKDHRSFKDKVHKLSTLEPDKDIVATDSDHGAHEYTTASENIKVDSHMVFVNLERPKIVYLQDNRSEYESYITDTKHINWTRNDFVDYRDLNHTGYFRDQKRRVDMIIVVDDTANPEIELIKDHFFMNVLNAGLEFELETGVLPKNRGLVFVKLHAPDAIILSLAKHFGLRKYFKTNHLEFTRNAVPDERNIIRCIRRNYPGPYSYSTIDRITLVFRLLRLMPFGDTVNHRGVEKLLERGILRDMYPVHDGPYYIMDKKETTLNGRQALYANWVGNENILKRQPVNTIREYLGERIGFLFAFFEFYNLCLVATWIWGAAIFTLGYFSKSNDIITHSACTNQTYKFPHWFTETVWLTYRYTYTYDYDKWDLIMFYNLLNISIACKTSWWKWWMLPPCPYNYQTSIYKMKTLMPFGVPELSGWLSWVSWLVPKPKYWAYTWTVTYSRIEWRIGMRANFKITTYHDLPICPKCKDFKACPFINMTKYCLEVKIKNILDNPYSIYSCAFIFLWGMLFYVYWQRRECYLYWLWECREEDAVSAYRPDFMQVQENRTLKFMLKFLIILFILIAYFFAFIPVLLLYQQKTNRQLTYLYKTHEELIKMNYFNVAMVSSLNGFLTLAFLLITLKATFPLNRILHNLRTEKQYERSLTLMMFGFTFYLNFGFIFYFTYIKGIYYTYPSDESRWYAPLGIGFSNCGLLSCIDEVFLVFIVTQVSKKCYQEFDQMFQYHPTDYVGGKWINQNVPSWEKELDLMQITEADIMKKFNYLIFQYVLVTFYFWLFPLTGAMAFFMNMYEIRYWSKMYLLHSRRPLPLKTWGLGSWKMLLGMLPFMGALSSILAQTHLSNMIPKAIHDRYFPGTRYFMDFALGMFNTSDFFNTSNSRNSDGNYTPGSPAFEWHQYSLARYNKHLYPHWQKSDFCLFPTMYNRRYKSHKLMRVFENSYMPNLNFWHTLWLKILTVLAFEQFCILSAIIINMLIDTCSEKVRTTRDVEHMISSNRLKAEDMKKQV